jgi:hypothetical protein
VVQNNVTNQADYRLPVETIEECINERVYNNMNIDIEGVEEQIQALEGIPKLGRDLLRSMK